MSTREEYRAFDPRQSSCFLQGLFLGVRRPKSKEIDLILTQLFYRRILQTALPVCWRA